jgi:glucose-1-phosphate cytidylyltransferase
MKVVILCGGKGVRAFPFTQCIPKPMLPVNGSPILVQLIKSFISQGFDDFVLAAGYRKNVLDDYFEGKSFGGRVTILDTGAECDTGERVAACRSLLGERFLVTYGDGLSDVPLARLVDFHRSHGGLATVTAVPLFTQYGVLEANGDGRVTAMREKPILRNHWINIGFMVFERTIFEHWTGTNLERDVLPELARRQTLYLYRHEGFFKSMDSYKDQQEFEELSAARPLPWAAKASISARVHLAPGAEGE